MSRASRARPALGGGRDQTWIEDLWDEPVDSVPLARCGPEALQGAWLAVAGRRQAELLVSGDHLTVHFAGGDIYMGRFTLGEGRPAPMDVRVEEGPPRHKGQVARCIWEVEGDTLRWCIALPGQDARPASFAEDDPQHLCLVFHREHTIARR